MGWDSCEVITIVSLWNRLLGLPSNRVESEISYWDLSVKGEWPSEIFELLEECVPVDLSYFTVGYSLEC